MKIYIVTEAQYDHGYAYVGSITQRMHSYAQAHATFDAAYNALRELADERIYEAYEGHDERDRLTDDAMADTFGDYKSCDVTPNEADIGWSWENAGRAYVWRIIEEEV